MSGRGRAIGEEFAETEAQTVALNETLDADTRDAVIAESISGAEGAVSELVAQLGRLVEHARAQDAEGHALLYEHVQGHLAGAVKDLGRAWCVMADGDPDDYGEVVTSR